MSYHPPSCQYSFCTTFLCVFFFTKGLNFAFYIFCCFFYFLFFYFIFFFPLLECTNRFAKETIPASTQEFVVGVVVVKKKEHTRIEEKQQIDIVYAIFFFDLFQYTSKASYLFRGWQWRAAANRRR